MKAIRDANTQLEEEARTIRGLADSILQTIDGTLTDEEVRHIHHAAKTIRTLAHNLSL